MHAGVHGAGHKLPSGAAAAPYIIRNCFHKGKLVARHAAEAATWQFSLVNWRRAAYNLRSMRTIGVFICALPLFGQSLKVSSVSAAPGEKVAIEIALDSPAGQEPIALQWEAGFPGEALKLDRTGPAAGAAAQAAGKSLTCAPKKAGSGPSKFVCILAGGQKPIGNGVVAVLHFEIQPNARAGAQHIVVDNLLGVSAGIKKVPILRAEGAVQVLR
jgi:hypothetical protein